MVTDTSVCIAGTPVSSGGGSVSWQVTYNGASWMPAGGAAASTDLAPLRTHQMTTSRNNQTLNASCDTGYAVTEWDFGMNHQFSAPTLTIGANCAQGQKLIVEILQDADTGVTPTLTTATGYTLIWQATGGVQPSLTAVPNARDGLKFQLNTYPSGNNLILWAWLPNTAPIYAASGMCPSGEYVTPTTTPGVICAIPTTTPGVICATR
jgi:hypothetical protein